MSIMMQLCEISIHALLAESDFEAGRAGMQAALFLSTLSLRRATSTSAKRWMPTEFLSTLSLRRATGRFAKRGGKAVFLSTLSLRRATNTGQPVRGLPSYFYPRSPCGERRLSMSAAPLARRISIHALLAESDIQPQAAVLVAAISIHALLAESDLDVVSTTDQGIVFLSTLSLRRATRGIYPQTVYAEDFYPRSPCGERQMALRVSSF